MSILAQAAARKRGLAAPLLFLALAFAAAGSADDYGSPIVWLASLCLLGLGSWLAPTRDRELGLTPLLVTVFFFSVWLVCTNAWVLPYSAFAPYHAAFLLGGFVVGRRVGPEHAVLLFRVALAFGLAIAGWAIWQFVGLGLPRATAIFETPATLSAAMNLILLPALVVAAGRKSNPMLLVAVATLSGAALVAAGSRGGWLAVSGGALVAWLLARRGGIAVRRESLVAATGAAAVGAAILWAGGHVLARETIYDVPPGDPTARLELYRLAATLIADAWSPALGSGYLVFHQLFEASRPSLDAVRGATTYFVHNDYLQTLLELGIPGLAGLGAVVALPLVLAWRRIGHLVHAPDRQLLVLALTAGLASMGIHAIVDFPFHIPACQLLYGAMVGLLDSTLSPPAAQPAGLASDSRPRLLRRAAVAALGVLGFWTVLTPAAAHAAASYANHQWASGRGLSAAYWFEVARRLEPRDWRFHWYMGRFWYLQAVENNNPAAARLADVTFAAGAEINPLEFRNLLGRIVTHTHLRKLVPQPADPRTLRAWCDRALALAPLDPQVQAEVRFARAQIDDAKSGEPQ